MTLTSQPPMLAGATAATPEPVYDEPPPFPRTSADLPAWHVYADLLLSRGERLGELLAIDLALPRTPPRGQLESFHGLARRVCHGSRWLEVGWCLGHARMLSVRREFAQHAIDWIPDGALAVTRDFLRSPQGRTIERFHTFLPHATLRSDPWWPRVMAALPPTCEELILGLPDAVDWSTADELFALLPATVRTLGLWRPRAGHGEAWPHLFVDDRLECLDLTWWRPTHEGLDALFGALRRSRTVKLRLSSFVGPLPVDLAHRVLMGETGFLAEDGQACALPRWPLRRLQRHFGIVSVQAQLHRLLAERFDLDRPGAGSLAASFQEGNALVRHGSGEWTVRSTYPLPLHKNGVRLAPGALPVPLLEGEVLSFGEDPTTWRFVREGLDQAFHQTALRVTGTSVAGPSSGAR